VLLLRTHARDRGRMRVSLRGSFEREREGKCSRVTVRAEKEQKETEKTRENRGTKPIERTESSEQKSEQKTIDRKQKRGNNQDSSFPSTNSR
jgi:hypothetical protein